MCMGAGKQLWWNWELDVNHYSGWHERLRAYTEPRQIRIMTYVNPYLADVRDPSADTYIFRVVYWISRLRATET
jgi:hypothetical protein